MSVNENQGLVGYLEGVVLGEGDNLHDLADPGEDLVDDVQRDRVDHVLNNHTQHRVRTPGLREQTQHTFGAEL